MIQRITIAKVAGISGQRILAKVQQWAALEAQGDGNGTPPPKLIKHVTTFVEAFRANAAAPPVLYFADYIDQWSVAFSQLRWFPQKHPPIAVQTEGASVAAYSLPDKGFLSRHVNHKLKRPTQWDEDRWFLSHLHDAIGTYNKIVPQATLVIIRQSWAASPTDHEVIVSSDIIPKWLTKST